MSIPDLMAALQTGIAFHRAGRLDEAEHAYRGVLRTNSTNVDALHLLGVLHRARGDPLAATELIGQALRQAPAFAEAHANFGNALVDLERFDEAAAAYSRALDLDPGRADIRHKLIVALKIASDHHLAGC